MTKILYKAAGGRPRVITEVRVRYAETDAMAVVYYGVYFSYFEDGRTQYLRVKGVPYTEMEKAGIFMPVVETFCRYHAPARFEDVLTVDTTVASAGHALVRFEYVLRRDDEILAEGYTVHAARGKDGKPVRIPAGWAAQLGFPKSKTKGT